MPPKPQESKKEDEMSYNAQLRRMGKLPEKKEENSMQKKYERRIRLRKIRESVTTGNAEAGRGDPKASKVLNALKDMGGKGEEENEAMDQGLTGIVRKHKISMFSNLPVKKIRIRSKTAPLFTLCRRNCAKI